MPQLMVYGLVAALCSKISVENGANLLTSTELLVVRTVLPLCRGIRKVVPIQKMLMKVLKEETTENENYVGCLTQTETILKSVKHSLMREGLPKRLVDEETLPLSLKGELCDYTC